MTGFPQNSYDIQIILWYFDIYKEKINCYIPQLNLQSFL